MERKPVDKRIVYIAYPCFVVSAVAVNFLAKSGLAKWGCDAVPAFELNGLRLVIAGLVLLTVAFAFRINLTAGKGLWKYAIISLLTMAVPQALLFYAYGGTATPNKGSFAEATVPGIILIYLLAERRRLEWKSTLCIGCALAGLAVFLIKAPSRPLNITGCSRASASEVVDVVLLILSSVVTALGLVLADILLPKTTHPSLRTKLSNSLKNNVYMTCIAGGVIMICVAMMPQSQSTLVPPRAAWPEIITLALLGTCLGWISFFLLLAEDVVLASSAIIAIPVVTALVSATAVWLRVKPDLLGEIFNIFQLFSAVVVLLALFALIALKLRKPS